MNNRCWIMDSKINAKVQQIHVLLFIAWTMTPCVTTECPECVYNCPPSLDFGELGNVKELLPAWLPSDIREDMTKTMNQFKTVMDESRTFCKHIRNVKGITDDPSVIKYNSGQTTKPEDRTTPYRVYDNSTLILPKESKHVQEDNILLSVIVPVIASVIFLTLLIILIAIVIRRKSSNRKLSDGSLEGASEARSSPSSSPASDANYLNDGFMLDVGDQITAVDVKPVPRKRPPTRTLSNEPLIFSEESPVFESPFETVFENQGAGNNTKTTQHRPHKSFKPDPAVKKAGQNKHWYNDFNGVRGQDVDDEAVKQLTLPRNRAPIMQASPNFLYRHLSERSTSVSSDRESRSPSREVPTVQLQRHASHGNSAHNSPAHSSPARNSPAKPSVEVAKSRTSSTTSDHVIPPPPQYREDGTKQTQPTSIIADGTFIIENVSASRDGETAELKDQGQLRTTPDHENNNKLPLNKSVEGTILHNRFKSTDSSDSMLI